MQLTPDQLATIDRHLRKENWLLNEDLIAELTDHYATGIADRMAQGQAFSEALIEVFKGFGFRKGLLQMEEDYRRSQVRSSSRVVLRLFASYFHQSRLAITILVLTLVYGIVKLSTPLIGNILQENWLWWTMLSGQIVAYILAFVYLIREFISTKKNRLSNMAVLFAVNTVTCFVWFGTQAIHHWSINKMMADYPLPLSIVCTLFILLELSAAEILYNNFAKDKEQKIA